MKKCILITSILLLVFVRVSFTKEKDALELKELREDIQILNLVNSLNLTKPQMALIIEKAKEAAKIKQSALVYVSSEAQGVYQSIKEQVESGKVVIDPVTREKFRDQKKGAETLEDNARAFLQAIINKVEGSLQSYQLIALDGYKPCIIPIMQDGRIGQSDKGKGFCKVFESVKRMPQERFSKKKEDIAFKLIQRVQEKLSSSVVFDQDKARVKILAAFDQVRAMDDADFLTKKASFAEELLESISPPHLGMKREDKIKRFLLSERIIPILEKKMHEM